MVMTFHQMIWLHFFMGFGAFGFIGFLLFEKGWHRWPLVFGEGLLGQRMYWLGWLAVAYGFEIISSIGSGFYQEVEMSPVEAICIVCGMFVADRILTAFEIDTSSTPNPHVTRVVRKIRSWWASTAPVVIEPEVDFHPHPSPKVREELRKQADNQDRIQRMRDLLH